jgi:20S proteasome alpha/beta subunit
MTCIVGLVQDDVVWIGGDSAGSTSSSIRIRSDPKVFKVGEYLFGIIGSFRMGNVLRYSFTPPKPPEKSLAKFMSTKFVDELRAEFKRKGVADNVAGVESGGTFLVSVKGKLFSVCSDYQIGSSYDNYDAIGSGSAQAIGALYATKSFNNPKKRIEIALEASERYSTLVRRPWKILKN